MISSSNNIDFISRRTSPGDSASKENTVNGLWIGDSLPLLAQLCITSFLRNGHTFRLFVYGEVKEVPMGTVIADASEVLPEHAIFYHATGSLAHFADWFRYRLLADQGGIWTDLDVVSLKPFVPSHLPWFALHKPGEVAIGFLAFPQGHELPLLLANFASDPATEMPWDSASEREQKTALRSAQPEVINRRIYNPYGSSGPTEFTKAVQYFELMSTAAEPFTLYPVPWPRWHWYFDGHLQLDNPLFSNSWALHLWGELLRREPDALAQLSPNSIVATLLELHGLSPPAPPLRPLNSELTAPLLSENRVLAVHPHWRDELVLFDDGTFKRVATDCRGNWEALHEGCIGLRWNKWTPEMLVPQNGDQSSNYKVVAWRASSQRGTRAIDFSFAILNHENPARLLRLINALNGMFDTPPISCHHDFGQCVLREEDFPSNVVFVRPSISTNWGGFSLVEASVMALRNCLSFAPRWTYLLSGADHPISTPQRMLQDLQAEPWSAHMHLERIDPECIQRPWHITCIDRYLARDGWPEGYACYAGSQWMTLGLRAIHYLSECFAQNHPLISRYRECEIPDESLFHTLLANNPSLKLNSRNWTYVDWGPGCPKYLTTEDLDAARNSGCHFARKFK